MWTATKKSENFNFFCVYTSNLCVYVSVKFYCCEPFLEKVRLFVCIDLQVDKGATRKWANKQANQPTNQIEDRKKNITKYVLIEFGWILIVVHEIFWIPSSDGSTKSQATNNISTIVEKISQLFSLQQRINIRKRERKREKTI